MYKWHVQSAIGSGRPIASDFARAAEGIAASLRQFSISASRAVDDRQDRPTNGFRITRSARTARAIGEVTSLAPTPSKGIDARSLAAKPPQGFQIRRVDESRGRGGHRGSAGRGRGNGGFSERGGGGGFTPRGGPGGFRGRGAGLRGRGGPNMRGRGRGRGGRKQRVNFNNDNNEDEERPISLEETAYMDGVRCGVKTTYTPSTSLESLMMRGPNLSTSSLGRAESILNKMRVATGTERVDAMLAKDHLKNIERGNGTVFMNGEDRALTEAFQEQIGREKAERRGVEYMPEEVPMLSESQKASILNAMVAGKYVPIETAEVKDPLGQVDMHTTRNETYLPQDRVAFRQKLSELLPTPNKTRVKAAKSV
ncbi:hypothetical protein B7494_g4195 [Chlorociboria aeruginascens]|nr:hypothetical protein B7494_g4195 [Chlorociboria aeruginascens]